MSVPRTIREIKGEEILDKWLDKLGIEEDDRLLFSMTFSTLATKLDDPNGHGYVVGINLDITEDTDGCIVAKAGNNKAGYIEKIGCVVIPRLVECCGDCKCKEKRKKQMEQKYLEDFDMDYVANYRVKKKVSSSAFAELCNINADVYMDMEFNRVNPTDEEKIAIMGAVDFLYKKEREATTKEHSVLLQRYDIDKIEAFRSKEGIRKSEIALLGGMAGSKYVELTEHKVEATEKEKIALMKAVIRLNKRIKSKIGN